MIESIFKASESDAQLAKLLGEVREYAQVYALARQRRKGCDGVGELAMVKEEFRDSLDDLMDYCKGKKYLSGDIQYDIDSVANDLVGMTVK